MTDNAVKVSPTLIAGLLGRQFIDKQKEHSWNDFQMERDCGGLGLTVWSRDLERRKISVQIYGDNDNMIHLCEGYEDAAILDVVDKAVTFLDALSK